MWYPDHIAHIDDIAAYAIVNIPSINIEYYIALAGISVYNIVTTTSFRRFVGDLYNKV